MPGARSRRGRWWATSLLCFAVGAVATAALAPLVRSGGTVGPGQLSLRADWGASGTALQVPPLGEILVGTHRVPMEVEFSVDAIDLDRAQALAADDDPVRVLESEARDSLQGMVRRLIGQLLLLAVGVGIVVGLVLPSRRLSHVIAGVAGGAAAIGLLVGAVWVDYDVEAFAEPRFEGALARAPQLLDAVEREYGNLAGLRDRAQVLAGQLQTLSEQATTPLGIPQPSQEVRLLHISDVHLNPVALEAVATMAEQFDVDAVLDTGDLTSFGLSFEAEIGSLIDSMPVPYYFVPGNHDSPSNRAAVGRRQNVTVLDGEIATIRGLRVLGVADPQYSVDDGTTGSKARAARSREAGRVAALVEQLEPDVLAVAGLQLAERSIGSVPLVVSGDVHERTEEEIDGTRLLTVGSTGAGGLGSFTVDTEGPYEAQILRFVDDELTSIDYVTLRGLSGNFIIDRTVYSNTG